jgi:hypothetical protein
MNMPGSREIDVEVRAYAVEKGMGVWWGGFATPPHPHTSPKYVSPRGINFEWFEVVYLNIGHIMNFSKVVLLPSVYGVNQWISGETAW